MLPQSIKKTLAQNPSLVIFTTFFLAITIGTLLLALPMATHEGIAWVDAFFTATSAVCVTGLVVHDTGSYFTWFGQVVILVLIQLGGLGILTCSAVFLGMVTGRVDFYARAWIEESLSKDYVLDFYSFLKRVFVFVAAAELLGALLLFSSGSFSVFSAIFHSVSAFCNAGFYLFPDSLASFRASWFLNTIIMALIVVGGIGFVVIEDICLHLHKGWKHLLFHSRIVILASAFLIFGGALVIYLLEHNQAFAKMSAGEAVLSSFFQSVTCRTAGFYTVDLQYLSAATLFLMMGLMAIGGSPGSTAGGLKTTSFVLILTLVKSRLKGRAHPELFRRTISGKNVEHLFVLILTTMLIIGTSLFVLLILETHIQNSLGNQQAFFTLFFEAISGFCTVGLSLGVTNQLSSIGKIIVSALMFLGRIGPLALAIFLMSLPANLDYEYPEEEIMIG